MDLLEEPKKNKNKHNTKKGEKQKVNLTHTEEWIKENIFSLLKNDLSQVKYMFDIKEIEYYILDTQGNLKSVYEFIQNSTSSIIEIINTNGEKEKDYIQYINA